MSLADRLRAQAPVVRQGDLRGAAWRLRHPRTVVAQTAAQVGTPTIYYLVPDFPRPAGGVRSMYQHVDGLNALGYTARVLHERPGFRCSWFEHTTPVTSAAQTALGPRDVLVVSELQLDVVARLERPCTVVVVNQSAHLTWAAAAKDVDEQMGTNPGIAGVVVVSEHSAEYVRHAFPHLPCARVRNRIDPAVFHPVPDPADPGDPVVLTLTRRGAADAAQVLGILRARGVLSGWHVESVGALSQGRLADALRRARIVLATSTQEGFGLPSAEAMACGAYVVGYDGFGGREIFRPELSCPVPAADVLAFARGVEAAIRADEAEPGWCRARGRAAAKVVLTEYSAEHQLADLAAAYGALLPGLTPAR